MNQENVGKLISQCRKEKGMTQAQLAEKIGVSNVAVSKWENGRNMPDASIMIELCNCLDISVNELLSGEKIKEAHTEESDLSEGNIESEENFIAEETKKQHKMLLSSAAPVFIEGIILVLFLIYCIIPLVKYNSAMKLYNAGNYSGAALIFNTINVKDSTEKAEECYFLAQQAELKNAKVGKTIKFGLYEQDNNVSNGREEIEWRVLDIEGNKALVVSEYGLDCHQYNDSYSYVTWEKCTLRSWLNEIFLNEAFSTKHQSLIELTSVSADNNPECKTNPGNDTSDKVFLLSIAEAQKYFSSDWARICKPTEYALVTGKSNTQGTKAICEWWLRSPGNSQSKAAFVQVYGRINYYGKRVDADVSVREYGIAISEYNYCVRPALWLILDN